MLMSVKNVKTSCAPLDFLKALAFVPRASFAGFVRASHHASYIIN